MRIKLVLLAGTLSLGCSLPKALDVNQIPKGAIAYQDPGASPRSISDGSLWQDRSLFADQRARGLNDLVTIRISESTTATVKGDLNSSRVGANSVKSTAMLNKLTPGLADGTASTSNTSTQFKGAGQTGRSAVFTSTVTARVVKVLGNGNLVVEGYRDVQVNNEIQRLYVAGMVDPAFLDVNNSISSSQMAELRVLYGGKGVVDETTKPGYLSRLLNLVWPY